MVKYSRSALAFVLATGTASRGRDDSNAVAAHAIQPGGTSHVQKRGGESIGVLGGRDGLLRRLKVASKSADIGILGRRMQSAQGMGQGQKQGVLKQDDKDPNGRARGIFGEPGGGPSDPTASPTVST